MHSARSAELSETIQPETIAVIPVTFTTDFKDPTDVLFNRRWSP